VQVVVFQNMPDTRFFLLLIALWTPFCSVADPVSSQQRIALSQSPGWQALLQYQRSDWDGRLESEVDSPGFFLAGNGKYDAAAELNATLEALQHEPETRCRFPARYQWLLDQHAIAADKRASCSELDEWLSRMNADSVTLIFPAAYMNSPSSMFGHTFLRIDQKDQNENNRLLAYTLNYAANVDETDGEIMYSYKGLMGEYPGVISVKPYYEKVKEYNQMENRDIWEFQLDLTQSEINLMLKHAWELKDQYFDYYFFDENCAYRILSLIDVARPRLQLTQHFYSAAIPADTVRVIVDAGVVSDVKFRPSKASVLRDKSQYLNDDERALAVNLAVSPVFDTAAIDAYPSERQIAIYETAFDYLRYHVQADKLPREDTAERSRLLLLKRSQIPLPSPFPPVTPPAVRDDQGHKTTKAAVAIGRQDNTSFTSIQFRPAYHDLLDPPAGYPEGAQIKVFELNLRHYETGTTKLEQLTLLNITSLTPKDIFFDPLSWRVDVGLNRKYTDTQWLLTPTLKGGAGASYKRHSQQIYALAEAQIETQHDLPSDGAIGLGANLGWLSFGARWQQLINYRHMVYEVGYEHHYQTLNWKFTYNWHKNLSLFAATETTRTEGDYYHEQQAGVAWYF
jgi:hypothetical protein